MSKFIISRRKNGEYQFNLQAGNSEIILTSEGYIARAGCENGIASVRTNSQNHCTNKENKVIPFGLGISAWAKMHALPTVVLDE